MERRGPEESAFDAVTGAVLAAAFEVHTRLGPGLLESAYEACLAYELRKRGHSVERQQELPLRYGEVLLEVGYRIDLLVDGVVIVEVKSVDALAPIHVAQLLTYLRLADRRVGLLLNFNVLQLRNGIKRIINSQSLCVPPRPRR